MSDPVAPSQSDTSPLPLARRSSLPAWIGGALVGAIFFGGGFAVGRSHGQTTAGEAACVLVNNVAIPQRDYLHRLQVAAGSTVLPQMIEEELRLQFARKNDVYPTDAEVEDKLAELRKNPNFTSALTKSHQTEDDIRHSLRVQLVQQKILTKNVVVTDTEAQAFYTRNIDKQNLQSRYYRPETVQVGAIVTTSQADAQKALAALARGQTFANVARVMSIDRSAVNGGGLPPFQRGRLGPKTPPELEKLVFSLRPGAQTDPQKIGSTWWIIRCVSHAAEATLPYNQVQNECKTGAMLTKGLPLNGAKADADFKAFRTAADIKPVLPEVRDFLPPKQ